MKNHINTRTLTARAARRGFTLLEVIVVVTIIALLATLVAPKLLGNVDKARAKKAQSEVNQIHQQVSLWMLDNNASTPPEDFSLQLLTEGADATLSVDDLIDPWENPYMLILDEMAKDDFYILSNGRDGQSGGEGVDADISSE